ncbi:MAG: hypothetical protein JWO27_2764 [Frankiales bacterium]|nr:hypothetical protein [Frankiales bacterium]
MTGPKDPGDDWRFPEVDPAAPTPDVGPASTELPAPAEDEPVYDTGSDAWWRAQAEAQREAAAAEPVVPVATPPPAEPLPPPELVEPQVLNTPTPLDGGWVPPELPELQPPAPEPPAPDDWTPDDPTEVGPAEDHPTEELVLELPAEGPDWSPGPVDSPSPAVAAAPMPEQTPAAFDDDAHTREPYEGERVGPARALAGAALALLGVLLAIGALIVFNGSSEPKNSATVAPSPSGLGSAAPSAGASVSPSARPSASPSARPTRPAPPVVASPPPATQAPVVPVTVLNNSRRTAFAKSAAARFRAGGWPVPTTGNYRGRISLTTVYYAPGQEASARRFAAQFHVPRVLPRSALPGIPSTGMTVVLTRDYTV